MRKLLTFLALTWLWASSALAQYVNPVNMRDANLQLTNTQNFVTTLNNFTAQRTLTVPGNGAMNAYFLQFIDTAYAISGGAPLRIVAADGSLINGLAAFTTTVTGVYILLVPSPSGYSVTQMPPIGIAVGGSNGQIQYNCNNNNLCGFTASGDFTINTSTGVGTLSTVNSNVGSWGSSTQCAAFTTNAKGLITAASQTTCTPAVGSITGLGTGVATALGLATNTNGGLLTGTTASIAAGALMIGAGSGTAPTGVNITGLVLGNGASNPSAYGGTTAGANQFMTGLSSAGVGTFAQPSTANLSTTVNALLIGNGSTVGAYGGATSCSNQFMTGLSATGASTCTTATLASAQFANQGTTTTVLHGNAAGNLAFSAVALATDVSGTLPVGNGGTGDTGTAWTTYTASPVCGTGSGTWTTTASRQKTMGKTVWFEFDVTLSAIGTCSGTVFSITLPSTAQSSAGAAGREVAVNGSGFTCSVTAAATALNCQYLTTLASGDRFNGSGVYESQ